MNLGLFLEGIPGDRLVCLTTSLTTVQHNADCKFFNSSWNLGKNNMLMNVVFSPVKNYSDYKRLVKISKYYIGTWYYQPA